VQFFLEDSSSSNDSDIKDVLFDDDAEQIIVLIAVKELADRKRKA
jgi:hypothetical protein